MATIKLTITVENLDNVMSNFDVMKVYRSTTGEAGAYSEITGLATRITLVAGQTVYQYDDTAGDPSYWYKVSYFNSVSSLESSLSDPMQGSDEGTYVSVDDMRGEGVPTSVSDGTLLTLIQVWQGVIERLTHQWFVARQMTWDFDGNGTTLAQFPVPIIAVTNLYINDDFDNALGADRFHAYAGRGEDGPDDRKNPRVRLVTDEVDIFTGAGPLVRQGEVFEIGEKNQRLEGSFGYVEADGTTPEPIKYALKLLVVRAARRSPLWTAGAAAAGPVVEEETDRHRLEYSDATATSKMWSLTGTGLTEVDMILAMYKAPIVIRAPRTTYRRFVGRGIL